MQKQLQLQRHQKHLKEQHDIIYQKQQLAAKLTVENQVQMSELMQAPSNPISSSQSSDHTTHSVQNTAPSITVASEPSGVINTSIGMQELHIEHSNLHASGDLKLGQNIVNSIEKANTNLKPEVAVIPSAGSTMQTVSSLPTSDWNSATNEETNVATAKQVRYCRNC